MNATNTASHRHHSVAFFTVLLGLGTTIGSAHGQPAPPSRADQVANETSERASQRAPVAASVPAAEADPEPPSAMAPQVDTQVPRPVAAELEGRAAIDDAPRATHADPAIPETVDVGIEQENASPKGLEVGEGGFVVLGSLMQTWIVVQRQQGLQEARDTSSTFRLRRAEIDLSGELIRDTVAFALKIDPAKTLRFGSEVREVEPAAAPVEPDQSATPGVVVPTPPSDTSVLQDFYITALTDYADISVGQFKIPISYEGYGSSSKLLLPERAAASKLFGDQRDVGIRVEKHLGPVFYMVGLYNGTGLNRLDDNNQKDAYLRLEYSPLDALIVGAAAGTSLIERDEEDSTKDRLEADLRVQVADTLLQAEYHHGWDGAASNDRMEAHGFYAALAYMLLDVIQPVVRVGYVDRDIDIDETRLWQYEGGLNYYLAGNGLKFQAAYTYSDEDGERPLHTGIAAIQLKY